MHAQQTLQVLELADHVIGSLRRLLTLLAHNAHAHVAVLNHDDVVAAIADRERHLARLLLHQLDDLGLNITLPEENHLLFGEHAAEDHGVHHHRQLHQRVHQRLLALVRLQLARCGDEGEHVARNAQREGQI